MNGSCSLFCVVTFILHLHVASSCTNNTDCSLNGVCTNHGCVCELPWVGEACSLLSFVPLPRPAAAYGFNPNVTSWGGNVIFGDADQLWHLYVSEIAGQNCGLTKWNSNSRVVHATAKSASGPYTKRDVALNVEAHNPHIIRWRDEFLLFHIGDASRTRPVDNCTKNSRDLGGFNSELLSLVPHHVLVHRSDSLDGPWTPANTTMPAPCNNPAPWVLKNGSMAVVCSGSSLQVGVTMPAYMSCLIRVYCLDVMAIVLGSYQDRTWHLLVSDASGLMGTWTSHEIFPGVSPPTVRPHKFWEDPTLWVDRHGHWHILAHCYVPHYNEVNDYISGHLYSEDGVNWIEGSTEPYRHDHPILPLNHPPSLCRSIIHHHFVTQVFTPTVTTRSTTLSCAGTMCSTAMAVQEISPPSRDPNCCSTAMANRHICSTAPARGGHASSAAAARPAR